MDVGRIEATLSARFDKDPFEKYDRALDSAYRGSQKNITADLDATYRDGDIDRYNRDLDQAQREARKGATAKLDARADTSAISRYKRELDGADNTQRRTADSSKKAGAGFTALASNARFLAGTAAIGGLTVALRSMYQEQAEAQAASASVRASLKTMGTAANVTAGDVDKLSAAISQKAAVDDEAVTNAAAMMLTFKNVRNETGEGNKVFDRSIELTADIARLYGTDMTRASVQVGKALNDPIKGINALSRQGLTFTEQQKEQIKTMVESGDVMGAQKLILKELESQVGDQAEAYGKTLPGAVDRTKIAFLNLMESLGGKIAPAVSGFADILESVLTGKAFKGGGAKGIFDPIISGAKEIGSAVAPIFRDIGKAFKDVFGGENSKGMSKDLQEIAKALGDALGVVAGIMRRFVPAFVGMWRGLFTVIRGILRVFGGILSGDWGRVWDGLKDIVSGAFKILFSVLRGVTAPIREILSRALAPVGRLFSSAFRAARDAVASGVRAIVSAIRAIIGGAGSAARAVGNAISRGITSVWNGIRSAVSAGARAVVSAVRAVVGGAGNAASAVGNAIANGFDTVKRVPGKVADFIRDAIGRVRGLAGSAASAAASIGGNIVSGMAGAIRSGASTILNAILNLLPGKIRSAARGVLGLARGGKVGPGAGGPQMYVAGEGNKQEWVISQEGSRAANVAWAVEALETLTGRRVAMFGAGGRVKNIAKKVKLPSDYATYWERQTTSIDRNEQSYGRVDREFNISQEEFLINNDDGSITVNEPAINKRIGELDKLKGLREAIRKQIQDLIDWINRTAAALAKAIAGLEKARKKANKKDREVYDRFIKKYRAARGEMLGAVPELEGAAEDSRIDLVELAAERAEVVANFSGGKAAPGDPGTGDPGTGDPGGGGGGDSGGDPVQVPPSPEEIARAAAEQVAAFNAGRSSLFTSFGQNFIGTGGTVTPLVEASGLRYFGGGMSDSRGVLGGSGGSGNPTMAGGGFGSAVNAGAGGVIITNNYAAPPPDPHTWSQGLAWEIKTAV